MHADSLASILYRIASFNILYNWDKLILFFCSHDFKNSEEDSQPRYLASHINDLIQDSSSSFFQFQMFCGKLRSSMQSVHRISVDVSRGDVAKAVCSFSNKSEVGPDGIYPQHLKELISKSAGEGGASLLNALTCFVNKTFKDGTPPDICQFFCGTALVAFNYKGGNMRPIAIGCTLKQLVAKCAVMRVNQSVKSLVIPHQLGFGVKHGAEAIVHSARIFLDNLQSNEIMIKLSFKNAFNSIYHNCVTAVVQDYVPELLMFVNSSYGCPSYYFCGDTLLHLSESLPLRDALAPFLFCITTRQITQNLKSDLKVFYLGTGILGGNIEDVFSDLEAIKRNAGELGLQLDYRKCEIVCKNPIILKNTTTGFEFCELKLVKQKVTSLLGCPIGGIKGIAFLFCKIINLLKKLRSDLQHQPHNSFYLLRTIYSQFNMQYILSCTPGAFANDLLQEFDEVQCSILSNIMNTPIECSDPAWIQATLPVKYGGLGVKSAVTLAPCAFLASASACYDLIHQTLPDRLRGCSYPSFHESLFFWQQMRNSPPPSGEASFNLNTWEDPCYKNIMTSLVDSMIDASSRIRILSSAKDESQGWIHGLLSSSLAQKMDSEVVRIAIGLRLGVPLCPPHRCSQCGSQVDEFGRHGLSCPKKREECTEIGSIVRNCLNGLRIDHYELVEWTSSKRDSSKDTALNPWRCGLSLVWDITVVDTFVPSHSSLIEDGPGALACRIEILKTAEKLRLLSTHCYVPLVVETTGVFGTETAKFFKELARRMRLISGDSKEHSSLLQRISIAVQCDNAASILSTT